jgi:hypothetical protein
VSSQGPNLGTWLRDCESGTLYKSPRPPGKDRAWVKAHLWVPVFGKNAYAYQGPLWERLEAR